MDMDFHNYKLKIPNPKIHLLVFDLYHHNNDTYLKYESCNSSLAQSFHKVFHHEKHILYFQRRDNIHFALPSLY